MFELMDISRTKYTIDMYELENIKLILFLGGLSKSKRYQ